MTPERAGRLLTAALVTAILAAVPATAAVRPGGVSGVRASATITTVSLSWRHRGVGVRFQVRYRRAGQRWRTVGAGRHRSLRLRGLRPATKYFFAVRACRRGRCSAWSRTFAKSTVRGTGIPPASVPTVVGSGGCPVFPSDSPWNRDISADPVDPNSATYIGAIGGGNLHPDFGSNPAYGIPYVLVGPDQPKVPIHFTAYGDESDPGPYPVPADAPVEGAGANGDRHVLVVQSGACRLYELYAAVRNADNSWNAGSGAVFDLRSNALRPAGWTSADAAGLPIFPGLVRYDEVQAGAINHAIRFTVDRTQRAYISPARHYASSSTDPSLPPMGLRLRLKAGYDISSFPPGDRVILTAMKRYGMIVADHGSSWFFTGATDSRWNDDELNRLKTVPGAAFEVVQTGQIVRG